MSEARVDDDDDDDDGKHQWEVYPSAAASTTGKARAKSSHARDGVCLIAVAEGANNIVFHILQARQQTTTQITPGHVVNGSEFHRILFAK